MPGGELPTRIGPYEPLRRIGMGGMGEVFIALDPRGRTVAVKRLRGELLDSPGARARLNREVEAMRLVRHPRVAELLHVDLDAHPPYLVTRYAQGRSLFTQVREEGPLPAAELERLLTVSADALAAIHDAGVVHRDLTPSNVLLDDDGPIVIDFGIAHTVDATRITRRGGQRAGSIHYMAPELWHGEAAGPAVDVFAWAATMVYAVTGRRAFGDGTDVAVMRRILHGEADLDGVPEPLRTLLAEALSLAAEDRPTAADLVARLWRAPEPHPVPGTDLEAALTVDLGEVLAREIREIPLTEPEPRTVRIRLPDWARTGTRLRSRGGGLPGTGGGPPGDLLVELTVRAPGGFTIDGDDLRGVARVDEDLAAEGGTAEIPAPGGTVRVGIPRGTGDGDEIRVDGAGLPRHDGSRGDLVLRVTLLGCAHQGDVADLERARRVITEFEERVRKDALIPGPAGQAREQQEFLRTSVETGRSAHRALVGTPHQAEADALLRDAEESAARASGHLREVRARDLSAAGELEKRTGPAQETDGGATPLPGADRTMRISICMRDALTAVTRTVEVGDRQVSVHIPPGARPEAPLKVEGAGDPGRDGGPPGDLYVEVEITDEPGFTRDGDDLHATLRLTAPEARLGGRREVRTLDGRVVSMLPVALETGERVRIPGQGLPRAGGEGRGDLILTVEVLPDPSAEGRGEDVEARVSITLREAVADAERMVEVDGRTVRVHVPAGTRPGTPLRVPGEGRPGRDGAPSGDLNVHVEIEDANGFHRSGDDVHREVRVTPAEVRAAGNVPVRALDGTVTVKLPEGLKGGERLRVPNRGLPKAGGKGRGDLILTIRIGKPQSGDRPLQDATDPVSGDSGGRGPAGRGSTAVRTRSTGPVGRTLDALAWLAVPSLAYGYPVLGLVAVMVVAWWAVSRDEKAEQSTAMNVVVSAFVVIIFGGVTAAVFFGLSLLPVSEPIRANWTALTVFATLFVLAFVGWASDVVRGGWYLLGFAAAITLMVYGLTPEWELWEALRSSPLQR